MRKTYKETAYIQYTIKLSCRTYQGNEIRE